jgi:hypothetical protein
VKPLLLLLLLLAPLPAQAQVRTDPYEHAHPTTGESGVWTPQWLQRAQLQRKASLNTCQVGYDLKRKQLSERTAESGELRKVKLELTEANSGLKTELGATRSQLTVSRKKAHRRLVWGWTSTGAAIVAILGAALAVTL